MQCAQAYYYSGAAEGVKQWGAHFELRAKTRRRWRRGGWGLARGLAHLQPTRGSGSDVSSPSGVRSGAPAANDFSRFYVQNDAVAFEMPTW